MNIIQHLNANPESYAVWLCCGGADGGFPSTDEWNTFQIGYEDVNKYFFCSLCSTAIAIYEL